MGTLLASKTMNRRGLFITFEGPEGSGKSSQARRLIQALRQAGRAVVFIRDPGTTSLGKRLRGVLLHETHKSISALSEALLFIAGRIQLVEEHILPALRAGKIVVCDRFHDSTMAYQGYGGRLNVQWLDQLGRTAIHHVMPNLTILLDVPTSVGFSRVKGRRDRMEAKALAFHHRLRRGYLQLAKRGPRRIVVIDGTQSPTDVARAIRRTVWNRLHLQNQ